mmetsp:Transcript_4196/g.11603  ORF Transcript_4196/g.11603 Transcript_4196/m.11603 type:complete len:283 (-) Transcript_4196:169-1017(-)
MLAIDIHEAPGLLQVEAHGIPEGFGKGLEVGALLRRKLSKLQRSAVLLVPQRGPDGACLIGNAEPPARVHKVQVGDPPSSPEVDVEPPRAEQRASLVQQKLGEAAHRRGAAVGRPAGTDGRHACLKAVELREGDGLGEDGGARRTVGGGHGCVSPPPLLLLIPALARNLFEHNPGIALKAQLPELVRPICRGEALAADGSLHHILVPVLNHEQVVERLPMTCSPVNKQQDVLIKHCLRGVGRRRKYKLYRNLGRGWRGGLLPLRNHDLRARCPRRSSSACAR